MKNSLLFISFLQFWIVKSQVSEMELNDFKFSYCETITVDSNFIYIGYLDNFYYDKSPASISLAKLDFNLNIVKKISVDSLVSWNSSSESLMLIDLIEHEDFIFITLMKTLYGPVTNEDSYLFKFDKNFNFIDSLSFSSDSLDMSFGDMDINGVQLFISGNVKQKTALDNRFPALIRVKNNFSDFTLEYFDNLGRSAKEFLAPKFFDSKTFLFVNSRMSQGEQIMVLDSNMQVLAKGSVIDSSSTIGHGMENRTMTSRKAFIPVTRDSIWVMGPTRSSIYPAPAPFQAPFYWTFGVSLLTPYYNVSSIDTFTLAGHNYTFESVSEAELYTSRHPMDYRSVDSVLFAQGARRLRGWSYSLQDSTEFYLYNFNARRGQMNWIRKIQRNYSVGGHSVAALPGNRWVLVFNEYDWDRYSGENLSVHIWILNGNGNILSTRRLSKPATALSLFPNPAQDFIQFSPASHWHGPLRYAILDLSGKSLRAGTVSAQTAQVPLQDLAPGTYFLHLRHAGEEVRGRFVVE